MRHDIWGEPQARKLVGVLLCGQQVRAEQQKSAQKVKKNFEEKRLPTNGFPLWLSVWEEQNDFCFTSS